MFCFCLFLYCVVKLLNELLPMRTLLYLCMHYWVLLLLSKISLNLRALVYNMIKTHFIGKYLMRIKGLNVANPISIQKIQLKSIPQSRISCQYFWTWSLVSISLLKGCYCWYFAGMQYFYSHSKNVHIWGEKGTVYVLTIFVFNYY